jgi:hypothetical protein
MIEEDQSLTAMMKGNLEHHLDQLLQQALQCLYAMLFPIDQLLR